MKNRLIQSKSRLLLAMILLATFAISIATTTTYAVTFSNANVINYIPINIINPSATLAEPANAIIRIAIPASLYSSYFACDLSNTGFFWQNGTQTGIRSLLDGNMSDLFTFNALCSNPSSPSALANATAVSYEINLGVATPAVLPAGGSNVIYFGLAGNTISTANTLFSLTSNTGASPWLTCNSYITNAVLGIPVCGNNYGKYDTGANVFTIGYTNFAGTSLPSLLHFTSSSNIVYINNGLKLSTSGFSNINTTPSIGIANGLIQSISYLTLYNFGDSPIIMRGNAIKGDIPTWAIGDDAGICGTGPYYTPWYYNGVVTNCKSSNTILGDWNTTPALFSIYEENSLCFSSQFNYGANTVYCMSNANAMTSTASAGYQVQPGSNIISYAFRIGVAPTNNINPTSYLEPIQAPSGYSYPTVKMLLPSNLTGETNSVITWSAMVTGGTGPYTYQWTVFNAVTGTAIITSTNSSIFHGVSTFSLTVNSIIGSNGLIAANVEVTDANSNSVISLSSINVIVSNTNVCSNAPTISWMGYLWQIHNSIYVNNSNSQKYCANPISDYVDSANVLHINQILQNNVPYGTYVTETKPLGYGIYNYTIKGDVSALDICADISPFLWQYPGNQLEVDLIELSRYCNLGSTNFDQGVHGAANKNTTGFILQPQSIKETLFWTPHNLTWITMAGNTIIKTFTVITSNTPIPGNELPVITNWAPEYNGLVSATANNIQGNVLSNFTRFNFTPAIKESLLSNSLLVGANQIVTANVNAGGWTSITYNYIITNSVTGSIVRDNVFNNLAQTGNTFTFKTSSIDTANSPENANVIVTYSNNAPSIMFYVPTYIGSGLVVNGWNALITNPYKNNITEADIFVATIGTTGGITYDNSGGSTDANINSIITTAVANNIRPVLVLGGSTQSLNVINSICTNSNFGNAVITNAINWLRGIGSGTKAYNGLGIDFENQNGNWACAGGAGNNQGTAGNSQLTTWIGKLDSNITTVNSLYTLDMFVAPYENSSFNYPALASNGVNYFDYADGQSQNVPLASAKAFAALVGTQRTRIEEDISGDANPFSYSRAQVSNMIDAGLGMSFFNTQPASLGTNITIYNAIGNNVTTYTTKLTMNSTSIQFNVGTGGLVATPNPFTLSNTIITGTQPSLANTVISGGSGGPYSGQFTFFNSNEIYASTAFTFNAGLTPYAVAINPQGTLAYITDEYEYAVDIFSTITNTISNDAIPLSGQPLGVAFNPQGTLAYVATGIADNPGIITVISASSNNIINTITTGGTPYDIKFNNNGTLAYVTDYASGNLYVINVASNTVVNTISTGDNQLENLAISPSGSLIYVTNYTPSDIFVISTVTNTVVNTITVDGGTGELQGIAINPQGTLAYVPNDAGNSVSVIATASNTVVNTITVGNRPNYVAFNPSGTLAYITNSQDNTTSIINVASNSVVNVITVGAGPQWIAFNPSGTLAYITNPDDGTLSILNNLAVTAVNTLVSNDLTLRINAVNSNTIDFKFGSTTYQATTGSSVANGQWQIYGFAQDNATNIYYYGSNNILLENTITITPPSGATISAASNGVADVGQYETFIGSIAEDPLEPYTYNFFVINSISPSIIPHSISQSNALTSNTYTFKLSTTDVTNSPEEANVIITDNTGNILISSYSPTFTINNAPTVTLPKPSNVILDNGQYVVYNTILSGGTGPFTVNLINNGVVVNSVYWSTLTPISNIITFGANIPATGNQIFTINAIDEGTTTYFTFNSVSNTITVYNALLASQPTPTNPTLDNGQQLTLASSISGGTGSYTYQWYTSTTNSCSSLSSIGGATSSTYIFSPANNGLYCYILTDTGTTTHATATSISAANIIVNPRLVANEITPVSPTIDNGQSIILTSNAAGGTTPYTINWFAQASCAGGSVATTPSNSFSPSTTTTYSYNVIDSATTKNTACSSGDTISVSNTLGNPSITPPTTNTVDSGQTITFTTSIGATGTANYIYKWTISNSVTRGTIYNTTTMQSTSATTNTFIFTVNAELIGDTIVGNVAVTDSAYSPVTKNSVPSGVQTIGTGFSISSFSISNPYADLGQTEVLNAVLSGGVSTYTYNYLIYNSVGLCLNKIFGGLGTSNTYTYTANALCGTGTLTANLVATDSISDIAKASLLYNVNAILAAGAITPNSPTIESGQSISLTANPSGGTLPYTYIWYTSAFGPPACNPSDIISGANIGTISVSPTASNTYTYQVTDAATTNEVQCSSPNQVNVVGSLAPILISPSTNNNVAIGGTATFSASPSGGIANYIYTWIISNSVTHGTIYNTTTMQSTSATTNTFIFNVNSLLLGDTFVANAIVTDSTSNTANSIYSGVFTVVSGTAPTYSFPLGLSLAYGSSETITGTCNGTDSCNIIINGVQVANTIGTGTVSYNFQSTLYGIGTFKIKFCDSTSSLCTPDPFLNVYSNIYLRNVTSNPAITFPTLAGISACTANFIGGTCIGNDTISGTQALKSNLFIIGNLITKTATLTFNGFGVVVTQTWNSLGGTLIAGSANNGGINSDGGNFIKSYGAAGGGSACGDYGGNTLAIGGSPAGSCNGGSTGTNGGNFVTPTVTTANIVLWFTNGLQNYLSGGGGGGSTTDGGNGGAGSLGMILEANTFIQGTINVAGSAGVGETSNNGGSGGGGGGGIAIIAVGSGGYVTGTNIINGGSGGVAGGGSGTTGGSGGYGNVIVFDYTRPPIPISVSEYYPIQYYNASAPDVVYTINQIYNNMQTALYSGVSNFIFVPLPTQGSGLYEYNFTETNTISLSSVSILANVSINMTDIASSFGFTGQCATLVEYFPNCALAPIFTVTPKRWNILSDNSKNTYQNGNFVSGTNNIDIWSHATLSFNPTVQLNYSFTTFNVSISTNPLIGPITQTALSFIPSNTKPISPNTRILANLTTYDQQFSTPLNAITTITFKWTINNYTGTDNFTMNTNITGSGAGAIARNTIWTANASYVNPAILLSNLSTLSTAASHYPAINNFFSNTINYGTWPTYPVYLANNANASLYTFYVYQCNGYAPTGSYMWSYTGSSASSKVVQEYKINAIPFSLPLQNGQQYQFQFWTAGQALIYTQPFTVNPLTITIYLPCSQITVTNPAPVINATCDTNLTSNVVTCKGIDTQNYVNLWTVSIKYHPNIFTTQVLAENIINTSSSGFTWTYQLPNHTVVYYATINATLGRNIDPIFAVMTNFPLFSLGYSINPTQSYDAIFGILLFFVFLGVAYINEIAAMIGFPLIMIIGNQLQIFQFAPQYIYGSIGIMIIISILMMIFRD